MFSVRSALCAILAAGCAFSQPATPDPDEIGKRITANGLKADVSFLASDALQGRGTPSPGLDIAGEFVAAQFRRAGLEPAGDDGYFQTAPYVTITPNLDGLQLTFDLSGKTVTADRTKLTLSEPAAVELKQASAFWATLEDAAALDGLSPDQVRGKVLILGMPQTFRRIPASVIAKLRPALLIQLRSDAPGGRVGGQLREASGPAVPTMQLWDPAVRDAFAAMKPGRVEGTVSAHIAAPTTVPVKLRNVVGVLRGSDPVLKDTCVLLTAHYDHLGMRGTGPGDHIYNGANDDASGTSSVIEIANALASLPRWPKRSIVFVALFGEELGLFGSRYYAQHPVFPLAKTIADLNLEHLGRTDVEGGPRVGQVNATGYDFTNLPAILGKAGQTFGIEIVKDEQNSDAFYARSDNQAFADAGIPSHTLSVGYIFPDYHQVGDEWPKLDYENMAKVDRAVALALFRVADSSDLPKWNTANPKTEKYVKAQEALKQP